MAGGKPARRSSETIGHGGPDELYSLRHALTDTADQLGAAEILSMIRLCGHDARVMAECIRPLWRHVAHADARLRLEIRDAALAAWDNYFHLGEEYDLAFNLALLLYETHAYVDAHALFEESVRLYGENGATRWNLGLCQVALGKPDEALVSFQRARALAPDLYPAGLAVVKAPPTDSRPSSAARDSGGRPRRRPGIASLIFATSSGLSFTFTASTFSSRRWRRFVPGIGTMSGPWARSHASTS